jgi:hypothetical protein
MMLPCNDAKGFQDRLDGMATNSDRMSSGFVADAHRLIDVAARSFGWRGGRLPASLMLREQDPMACRRLVGPASLAQPSR